MALVATNIARKFKYNGIALSDPSPEKTVDQVRMFFATQYPELLNSVIEGPDTKNGVSTYSFARAVGSKGAGHLTALRNITNGTAQTDNRSPLIGQTPDSVKETSKCSTIVQAVVGSRQKSASLIAPAQAFSRFG